MDDLILNKENGVKLPQKRKGRVWKIIGCVLFVLVTVILSSVIIVKATFSAYEIIGESMRETIQDGDFALMLHGKAERGDIVSVSVAGADKNNEEDKRLLKRVIGVGGDKLLFVYDESDLAFYAENRTQRILLYRDTGDGLTLVDESTYIKGRTMYEKSFITQAMFETGLTMDENVFRLYAGDPELADDRYIIEVPEGKIFVLGDNRNNSLDSRNYGFFDEESVTGILTIAFHKDTFMYDLARFIYIANNTNS